jgi:hypothetical protein
MMKARPFQCLATALLSLAVFGPASRGAADKIFQGEIADSQCALNVHSLSRSHKEMIDMGSAGSTPAECARYCVTHRGGRYVLQTKLEVYKLDNQDLAAKSVGLKVKLTGTLDPKTNTIQVRSIDPIAVKDNPK